ncbi:hypothetical protein GOQ30_11615 [Flavobacterium sp. TP390]|uniref:Uncharacterized protein n=1 Tax=Flavobacterium profundi TaxID=1774945 RepID=A0A6I4IST6_9FLAO|nr:hypothetical protein [Flavobacterium profundi]MVO09807.1 hypothetical protein [Flavobacterium profundi]
MLNKKLKLLLPILLLLICIQNVSGKNGNPKLKNNCEGKVLTITTAIKIKHKYFFFRKTNHKRVTRIDEIVNENGAVLMKIKMKSSEKGDTYDFRKFHRLVLVNKEIHEVICIVNQEFGRLIIYNFCGEKMTEVVVKSNELYNKYRF